MPGGAADQAGLVGAKSIAVRASSSTTSSSASRRPRSITSNDLYKALDTHKVGDTIELTVENHGKRRTAKVTLQAVQ